MSLEGKKIVLGITGGIAAFKAASIASQLRKSGAEVKCIMTAHATELITPLTLREISGNPVAVSMFEDVPEFNVEHIALARWADVLVIAPATANIIGKIANGIADDMLTTTVMATTAPILIAPAMNSNMYMNPITQDNMAKLKNSATISSNPTADTWPAASPASVACLIPATSSITSNCWPVKMICSRAKKLS